MSPNEACYRRTVSAIGSALLIWLVMVELFGIFVSSLLPLFLSIIPAQYEVVSNVLYWTVYILGDMLCFVLPVLFLRLFMQRSGGSIRPMYSEPRISKCLPLMIFACITVSFSASFISSAFFSLIGASYDSVSSTASADPALYELIFEFISLCLIPGFCEELLFRGAILSNLLPFGKGKAIFISALLFSLMHGNAFQIFYTFVAGLFLGLVYEKTKSIWNCVLIHIANNFLSYTENTVAIRIKDGNLSFAYTGLLELLVISLGVFSVVILALRFFSKKNVTLQNGFFEKRVEPCDEYAQYPVGGERAVKLFMAPTMVVFVSLCVVQIIGGLLILIVGGKLLELLG